MNRAPRRSTFALLALFTLAVTALARPLSDSPVPSARPVPGERPASGLAGDVSVLGTDEVPSSSLGGPRPSPTERAAGLPEGTYVASPAGKSDGDGSLARPLDLTTALSSKGPVGPGDTLLLRGGKYAGAFVSELVGESDARILVTSYPGEWAVLDGGSESAAGIDVKGPDVTFRAFEVMKSDPKRTIDQPTNHPADLARAYWSGVFVRGMRTKLINLVVHDNGDGIGLWRASRSSEVSGCVIYNNGWLGSDRGWGHGIYTQNGSGLKKITDNIVFNNFGFGIHAYDEFGTIRGYAIDGNTSFENGMASNKPQANMFVGSVYGLTDQIAAKNNVLYHRPGGSAFNAQLGYPPRTQLVDDGSTLTFTDNTIVGGTRLVAVRGWSRTTVERNFVFARPGGTSETPILAEHRPRSETLSSAGGTHTWTENTYRDANVSSGKPSLFGIRSGSDMKTVPFSQWRSSTGLDGGSEYTQEAPTGTRVTVRPSAYEQGRAIVTILNWTNAKRVKVDLSAAKLERNQRFEIRDVQNLKGAPLMRGRYNGRSVSIPMTKTTVTQPIGASPFPLKHTPQEFGAFVVLPLN